MHLFSVSGKNLEKHYLYYSDNILWSVFLLISILCSNIFSHAAKGQRMRHKGNVGLFDKDIMLFCMGKK